MGVGAAAVTINADCAGSGSRLNYLEHPGQKQLATPCELLIVVESFQGPEQES